MTSIPTHNEANERELEKLIEERDYLESMCDKLAARIAPPHVLGEHSSDNDPWLNALNYGDSTPWDNVHKDEIEAREEAALAEADLLNGWLIEVSSKVGEEFEPLVQYRVSAESADEAIDAAYERAQKEFPGAGDLESCVLEEAK